MNVKLLVILVFVSFCICIDIDITKGPPQVDKPSVAAHGWYGQSLNLVWKETHENFLKLTREFKDHIKVVFIGDSITQEWVGEGKEVWNKFYTNISAHNYGIAGDSTRQILWRIQNGELNGFNPKLIVLMIGTNNLYNNYNRGTDEEIAEAIKLIIDQIKAKLPDTHIILLGILPRYDSNGFYLPRIKNINSIISHLNDSHSKSVHYLDIGSHYQETNGHVKSQLFIADFIHLSKEGYQVWHNAMDSLVKDEIIE